MLLGTDNYHLIYPKKEVIGGVGDPWGRPCPSGWTAVVRINKGKKSEKCTIPIYVKPFARSSLQGWQRTRNRRMI